MGNTSAYKGVGNLKLWRRWRNGDCREKGRAREAGEVKEREGEEREREREREREKKREREDHTMKRR